MKSLIHNLIKTYNLINENNDVIPGKIVWRHIISITPNRSDVPDYFGVIYVKPRKFKYVMDFPIRSLLETDPDFKEYYETSTDRYEDDEDVNVNDLNNEITVVDGMLIDGYNRCLVLLNSGEEKTGAFVAI